MPAGRPRKPDAVHELQGTIRADRHGDPSAKPRASEAQPEMPLDFETDDIARQAWEHLVEEHTGMRLLSRSYQVLMELFCRTYSKYMKAEDEVRRLGIVGKEYVFDRHGEPRVDPMTGEILERIKRNPACVESRALLDALKQMLPELGLTPVSLSKLNTPNADEGDPLNEFLDDDKAVAGKIG